jgi:hypothetical protein
VHRLLTLCGASLCQGEDRNSILFRAVSRVNA